MNFVIIGILIFCGLSEAVEKISKNFDELENEIHNPDVYLPTTGMIKRAGYPVESHFVTTKDGYILTMHRIPGSSNSKPIFLQHGLLGSSADWVMSGKYKSIAYKLFNRGYDVWLGNIRGNTYSRAHLSLSPSDSQFWNFSWHEAGIYDLPAMISYVVNSTEQSVTYIGHSMGTTMFFVMAAERPDLLEDGLIRGMFALAPVAFVNHLRSPIRIIAPFSREIEFITHYIGEDEFLPQNVFIRLLAKYGCDMEIWEKDLCRNILFVICGQDKQQFNMTLLPVILHHTPAGASTKSLIHYAQEIISGKFRKYDYGWSKNIEVYNSTEPPEYNLTKINVPVALFYSANDKLASTIDVQRLADKLPNKMKMYEIPYPEFNHLDFLWGIDAPKLVYKELLDLVTNLTNDEPVIEAISI